MYFSVCIPAWRASTVSAAIRSVIRQSWPRWELIVVGQGGGGSVRTAVAEAANDDPRVRYVHSERAGTTIARNVGIRHALNPVVALLDDDCEADPEWLATLAARLEQHPEVGLVSGAVVAPSPERRGLSVCPEIVPPEVVYAPQDSGRQAPPGWGWIGCNVAIRREVLEQVGLFDEHLGPGTEFPAAEDSDYLLRLEARNVRMLSTPRAIVRHTYGRRYGLQAVYRHSRSYAQGNGALGAKLTLLGDPRGRQWYASVMREATLGQLQALRPQRLPFSLLRLYYFRQSYRRCLHAYRVGEAGTLERAAGFAPRPARGSLWFRQ